MPMLRWRAPGSKMLCRTAPGIGLVFQLNFVMESFNFGIVHAVSFSIALYLLAIDSFNESGREFFDRLVYLGARDCRLELNRVELVTRQASDAVMSWHAVGSNLFTVTMTFALLGLVQVDKWQTMLFAVAGRIR